MNNITSSFKRMHNRCTISMIHIDVDNRYPCCSNNKCPKCFGTGYKAKACEDHILFVNGTSRMAAESTTIVGANSDSRFRAYFLPDEPISINDLLIECRLTSNGEIKYPLEIVHVYTIDSMEETRYQGEPVCTVCFLDTADSRINDLSEILWQQQ